MNFIAEARWRSKELNSTENCQLIRQQNQWLLRGDVTIVESSKSVQWVYQIVCSNSWHTQEVRLQQSTMFPITFSRTNDGKWYKNRVYLPYLDGAHDIDLGFTPATNTLPIRRQQPKINDTMVCHAAWLRENDCSILPVEQYYTRLGDNLYEYHNPTSGFRTQLEVDKHGLVKDYGDIWFSE
ncbi:putative glycolipid-binding domain-containing protein [Idiomarina seosinensis]|uniref:Glycolipid-binding domain-containing protein n=1 Tax=Idiomarina seosinensis TaxID=281739 RepID=A0A432ZHQ1_9GAMM|nr:putative glycolipid-binding domain-containing protein [Idiomarina seosinensis]RUO77459.1 hypothetical protein CWI81_02975 [Idiomarina seosinensis]